MLLFQKFQVIYPILNENIHFVEYEQICEYSSGKKNPTTFTSQFWIIIFHKRILYLSPEKTHNLVFNSCGPSWVCSQPLGRAMYIYSFSLLSSLIFWLSGLLRHNKEAFVQSQCLVIFNVAPNFVCLQKMMVKLGFVQITGHFSQPSHFDIW